MEQQQKDTAGLIWILAIFFSWLSSLIFYLTKKDDALVHKEAKEALNASLNYLIVIIVLMILSGILGAILPILSLVTSLLMLVAFVFWIYVCVKNYQAVKGGTEKAKLPIPFPFITLIK